MNYEEVKEIKNELKEEIIEKIKLKYNALDNDYNFQSGCHIDGEWLSIQEIVILINEVF
jgi:hypothetical protein